MKEQLVYDYLLNYHVGRENMIKNRVLREMFNVGSDKSMRKIIQNIREDKQFEKIVGSVSGKSGEFYICNTDEEIEETIENIRKRAGQMYRMCHVLEWKKDMTS